MTTEDLADLIKMMRNVGCDLRHVEAKRAEGGLPKSIADTLSAFSNTKEGGVIILGVHERDGFAITGVENPGRMLQDLGHVCTEMEPRIAPALDVHEIDGKHLIVAEVPELLPSQKPCFYRPRGLMNGAFIRVADGDRKLNTYEIHLFQASRGQPLDDQQPIHAARPKDLDPALVDAFLKRVRQRRPRFRHHADDEILTRLRVLVTSDQAGVQVPSLAGLMAFGHEPQAFLPELAVTVTTFPGRGAGELGARGERTLDDVRLEGPIPAMVSQALDNIAANLRKPRREVGGFRDLEGELPVTALSEALVNALAHRDFSPMALGSPVQVRIYLDRVEIENPGGLFGPVSAEDLGVSTTTSARNSTLMQLLEDLVIPGSGQAIAEHRGTGIPAMIQSLRLAEMSPPRFDDKVSTFRVTFPRESLVDADTLAWLSELGQQAEGITRSQRVALALMRGGEPMTNKRFRQATGSDSRDATRELRDLTDRDLVSTRGVNRWVEYVLVEPREHSQDLGATPGVDAHPLRRTRRDRSAEILALLREHEELGRIDIERALGLSQTGVNKWLRKLRELGEIEPTSPNPSDPNLKYRLVRRPAPTDTTNHGRD